MTPAHQCGLCGRPHSRRGIYCDARCAKAVENARRRGTTPCVPVRAFTCAWCGEDKTPGIDCSSKATRFCDPECKRRWHKQRELAASSRESRRRRAAADLAHAAHGLPATRLLIAGPCQRCGQPFVGCGPDARYCSDVCERRAQRSTPARIAAKRKYSADRRALVGEEFLVQDIGDRDHWLCGICDGHVDGTLSNSHRMGPTVDHVIPLSRGGSHTVGNVQLAHRACNSRKWDRLPAEANTR